MYEQFGSIVDQKKKTVTFRLFVPDGERSAGQYERGGPARIRNVSALGTFQPKHWDQAAPLARAPSDYVDDGRIKGTVSSASLPLHDGFYEYKYRVEFESGHARLI